MIAALSPLAVYGTLSTAYGAQNWWPAETAFEMMVGAILTQNTRWQQVEVSIAQLKAADCLTPQALLGCDGDVLQSLIRPSGFYRQKSAALLSFCRFYEQQGGVDGLRQRPLAELRRALLALRGVGPETADSMLLYALDQPVFVVDAYTRRLAQRLAWPLAVNASYSTVQAFFHHHLDADLHLFQEFHALIVHHAKQHCRKTAQCAACPLAHHCPAES